MFIKIIKINIADNVGVRPFKCVPVVRDICEFIISLGYVIIWVRELGEIQKVEVIVDRTVKLINQNIGVGIFKYSDLVAGSKDEKMSVNIKA